MSKIDIWMPIFIGDYLSATTELNAAEHGAYLLLLMHYWQKDGQIGSDIDRLARVCRSDPETCSFILGSYFSLIDGNYKNKRADIEIENAKKRRFAAAENGKKGGRPPKITQKKATGYPEKSYGLAKPKAKPNPEKSSSPSPSYIDITDVISNTNAHSDPAPFETDFANFWERYPRKIDKSKARTKYIAQRRKGAEHESIMSALGNYIAKIKRDGTDPQYIKYGASFLGCWEDYKELPPEAPRRPPGPAPKVFERTEMLELES